MMMYLVALNLHILQCFVVRLVMPVCAGLRAPDDRACAVLVKIQLVEGRKRVQKRDAS